MELESVLLTCGFHEEDAEIILGEFLAGMVNVGEARVGMVEVGLRQRNDPLALCRSRNPGVRRFRRLPDLFCYAASATRYGSSIAGVRAHFCRPVVAAVDRHSTAE